MTIALSRADLTALEPCDLDQRLALYGRRKSLTARQALAAGASVSDLLWVLGRLGRGDLCARFAVGEARAVAHLSADPRVMAAIDAAQRCLDDPTDENRQAAWAAAWAARAAAWAADARAAAWAAWAAADAADAADAAADARAAAWAAWAADAADAAGSTREDQEARFLAIVEGAGQ